MPPQLSERQIRALGALLEKQITTPDQYPLTLKSLTSACNQKSNRDPVMSLTDAEVRETVAELDALYLVSQRTEYGSRVSKHRQRFCNTEFGALEFTPGELAVMTLLMLRGAQTPGELRSRSGRLHAFDNVDEVHATLNELATRTDGPWVIELEREPGRRENRFMHCMGDGDAALAQRATPVTASAGQAAEKSPHASSTTGSDRAPPATATARIDELEARVTQLEVTLSRLREQLGDGED